MVALVALVKLVAYIEITLVAQLRLERNIHYYRKDAEELKLLQKSFDNNFN